MLDAGVFPDSASSDATLSPASARPPPNVGPATTSIAKRAFALRVLTLGDTDRAGVASPTAWRSLGYDVDRVVSTEGSVDHCALVSGAASRVKVDGERGIDNAFAAHVVPRLAAIDSTATRSTNESLAAGTDNALFETVGLDLSPEQTSSALTAQSFDGARRSTRPMWNGSDDFFVTTSSLNDGSTLASGSKTAFSEVYVNAGLFVATGGTMRVRVRLGGGVVPLTIHHATLTFIKPHSGFDTLQGTIAGVLDTDELVAALREEAGRVSMALCDGTTFDDLAQEIRQASDLSRNGLNLAGILCEGISIGLGFVATEIRPLATAAQAPPKTPDPCR